MKRTRLLDRWALRRAGACPFGVILRPSVDSAETRPTFPTWRHTPPYLPAGLAIDVADATPLAEPAVFHMAVRRSRGRAAKSRSTTSRRCAPSAACRSTSAPERAFGGSLALEETGAFAFADASAYLLTIDFSDAPEANADLRPELPLVLRW